MPASTFNRTVFRKLYLSVFLLATSTLTLPAHAEGWYAGLAIGRSENLDWCPREAPLTCDDQDGGRKLFAGKQFHPNAAVEIGYVDLGRVSDLGIAQETTGLNFSVLGVLPFRQASAVFGRLGMFHWDVKCSGSCLDDDGTDLSVGLGADFSIGKKSHLRLEWDKFDIDEDDVRMVSVGLKFHF